VLARPRAQQSISAAAPAFWSIGLVCSTPLPYAAPETSRFDVGCRVCVMSLEQAAQHNGKMGVVIALQTGRISLKLEDGSEVQIKPFNMKLATSNISIIKL
jgi:hypothetical protein